MYRSKEQRLAEWLGKKVKMEGREMNEMCRFFYVWDQRVLQLEIAVLVYKPAFVFLSVFCISAVGIAK